VIAENARDPGPRRFARRESEEREAPLKAVPGRQAAPSEVPAGDLLDRLERQTEEIAQLVLRQERLERALKTTRSARERLTGEVKALRAEKSGRDDQLARLLAERDEWLVSETEVARAQETAHSARLELHRAWAQIHDLQRQLVLARRPWWRRVLDLDPRG
jgi:predicted RNase H-like nuclease (RuvC/YqgF family)